MSYTVVTDADNKHHFLYQQEDTHSCGIACSAMMIHRMNGTIEKENKLIEISKIHDGGYDLKDGMTLIGIQKLLAYYGIQTSCGTNLNWEILKCVISEDKKPLIAQLKRNNGAHHFVFIDRLLESGAAVILDPDKSLGYSIKYLQKNRFPKYLGAIFNGGFIYPLF